MDRAKAKAMATDLQKVLDKFAEEQGLESITFNNIRFDSTGFKTTITVNEKLSLDDKEEMFDSKAMLMGLPKGLGNKIFNYNGSSYKIKDINTKAKKYPVIAMDLSTNNLYKFGSDTLRQQGLI